MTKGTIPLVMRVNGKGQTICFLDSRIVGGALLEIGARQKMSGKPRPSEAACIVRLADALKRYAFLNDEHRFEAYGFSTFFATALNTKEGPNETRTHIKSESRHLRLIGRNIKDGRHLKKHELEQAVDFCISLQRAISAYYR